MAFQTPTLIKRLPYRRILEQELVYFAFMDGNLRDYEENYDVSVSRNENINICANKKKHS